MAPEVIRTINSMAAIMSRILSRERQKITLMIANSTVNIWIDSIPEDPPRSASMAFPHHFGRPGLTWPGSPGPTGADRDENAVLASWRTPKTRPAARAEFRGCRGVTGGPAPGALLADGSPRAC